MIKRLKFEAVYLLQIHCKKKNLVLFIFIFSLSQINKHNNGGNSHRKKPNQICYRMVKIIK